MCTSTEKGGELAPPESWGVKIHQQDQIDRTLRKHCMPIVFTLKPWQGTSAWRFVDDIAWRYGAVTCSQDTGEVHRLKMRASAPVLLKVQVFIFLRLYLL